MACVFGPVVYNLALKRAVGNLLIVEGDVDKVGREFLRHESDVVESSATSLNLSSNGCLGRRHYQFEGALSSLAGIHGEGQRLTYRLGRLQSSHSDLLGVVDVAGVGGPVHMLAVYARHPGPKKHNSKVTKIAV